MKILTVPLQVPSDILSVLNVSQLELPDRLRQLVALELFREEKISAGKAAEMLGISKRDFVQLLAKHDIHYFRQEPEELTEEIRIVEQIIDTQST
jgi:predicted HTH domain antitoxin